MRSPWCVLEALSISLDDVHFAAWTRAQVLLINSAIARRYESKFGAFPYKLHRLASDEFSPDEKWALAESLLSATTCCLDVFSVGFRTRFQTVDKMLSPEALATLHLAFSAARLTTDQSERQNAEIQATRPPRGAPRDFEHFSRSNLLRQARTVHIRSGGDDPQNPSHLTASLADCRAEVMPLLAPQARNAVKPNIRFAWSASPHIAIRTHCVAAGPFSFTYIVLLCRSVTIARSQVSTPNGGGNTIEDGHVGRGKLTCCALLAHAPRRSQMRLGPGISAEQLLLSVFVQPVEPASPLPAVPLCLATTRRCRLARALVPLRLARLARRSA